MLTFNVITHTCNMGRHKAKTCNVCFKSMRGDNLKKHMKKHQGENEDNIVTKGLHDVKTDDNIVTKGLHYEKTENNVTTNGENIRYAEEKFIAVEKRVSTKMEEFDRKIELGREVNKIMDMNGYNENMLDNDMKEALKTYKLYGEAIDFKNIEWRGWQRDLREYLDKPCDRKVIWIVGKEGNEGKSFFQSNIREEFGTSRVCKRELSEYSRNTFHIIGKICSTTTDIFLFNVARGVYLDTEQYQILKRIKDGEAVDGKYLSRQLNFKKPNVLIVFFNQGTRPKYTFKGYTDNIEDIK